jgi:hypothetical protein
MKAARMNSGKAILKNILILIVMIRYSRSVNECRE